MKADYFRIAAIGDLHLTGSDDDAQMMRRVFTAASEKADRKPMCWRYAATSRAMAGRMS